MSHENGGALAGVADEKRRLTLLKDIYGADQTVETAGEQGETSNCGPINCAGLLRTACPKPAGRGLNPLCPPVSGQEIQ